MNRLRRIYHRFIPVQSLYDLESSINEYNELAEKYEALYKKHREMLRTAYTVVTRKNDRISELEDEIHELKKAIILQELT